MYSDDRVGLGRLFVEIVSHTAFRHPGKNRESHSDCRGCYMLSALWVIDGTKRGTRTKKYTMGVDPIVHFSIRGSLAMRE